MKTDKVLGADDVPVWDQMDDDFQRCWVEAFSTQVIKPLKGYVDDVEFDSSLDKTFDELNSKKTGPIPCYVCATNVVAANGKVCSECHGSFNLGAR